MVCSLMTSQSIMIPRAKSTQMASWDRSDNVMTFSVVPQSDRFHRKEVAYFAVEDGEIGALK